MKFNYQGRNKNGETKNGVVEASSKEAAFELLKSSGLYVLVLEEESTPVYAKRISFFDRVSNKDLVAFTRQLAIMLKSRVPVVETLQTLARQMPNKSFSEKILRIADELEGGNALSSALSFYPDLFSSFYINMVKAGEASGKMTDVFVYLADYLEREYAFRSKLTSALIYPAFIVVVFLIVASIIVSFVIPQLMSVITESSQSGQQLPWITQIVVGFAGFLSAWWWPLLGVIVLLGIGIFYYARTAEGKLFFDKYLLAVPLLGGFLKKFYLTRFALNLSTLISGGLPIIQALEITGEVVGNDIYKQIILDTKEGVKGGETISQVLERNSDYVSPLFYQMVVVGEKTGNLDSSLENVITFYQAEVDRGLDSFVKLLEPVLIIFLAVIVGGLMAAVLLPIYTMNFT